MAGRCGTVGPHRLRFKADWLSRGVSEPDGLIGDVLIAKPVRRMPMNRVQMVSVVMLSLLCLWGGAVASASTALGAVGESDISSARPPVLPGRDWTSLGRVPRALKRTPSGASCTIASTTTPTTSDCWSGYVQQGTTYSRVSAEWNVPSVSQESSSAWYAASTWIGVGGWNTSGLFQAGTTEESYDGTLYYFVWDENLPGQQTGVYRFAVNPGDTISATISQSSGSTWTLTVEDKTTGKTDNQTESYTGSTASAEFIQEAPSSEGSVLPLDPYETFPFYHAEVDGVTAGLNDSQQVTMPSLSLPSEPNASDNAFSMAYGGATPAPPSPPSATTEPATEEKDTSAILHGSVDPNSAETHYYFEYGPTTSYSYTTPEVDAGFGTSASSVSATITDLSPATLYHYRIVCHSWAGTSPGKDQTFTTLAVPRAAALPLSGGDQAVFFRGSNGLIDELFYNGSWHQYGLGGSPAPGAVPAAVVLSNGDQAVFFRSTYGDVEELIDNEGWKTYGLGGSPAEVGGDPTVASQSNGDQEVFFASTSGDIEELYYNNGKWQTYGLGGSPAGDPTVASPDEGHLVYFASRNGDIEELVYSAGWKAYGLKGSPATGAVPAVAIQSNNDQEVFFRGTSGDIEEIYYNGKWHKNGLGGSPTAIGGDPTVAVASNGDQEVFFRSTNGDIEELDYTGKWQSYGLGGSPNGDPIVLSPSEGHLLFFPSTNGDMEELLYNGAWKTYGLGGEPG